MLRQRVVTSLLAGIIVIACVFLLPAALLGAVFVVVLALAAWEWAGLAGLGEHSRQRLLYAVMIGVLALVPTAATVVDRPGAAAAWLVLAAFAWAVAAIWLATGGRPHRQSSRRRRGWLVLGAVVLPPPVLAIAWLAGIPGTGRGLLLYAMMIVWIADSAAYFTGRALGRRQLAPRVSAGKTWEGVIGGLLAVTICALVGAFLFGIQVGGTYAAWILLALVGASLSVVGDLLVSVLKREAGAKDSGTLLPGHGGMLDRVDGQLAALPLMALGLSWLVKGIGT